jgi:peptidoglycan/LPS O-acetylase OafA/YrhL
MTLTALATALLIAALISNEGYVLQQLLAWKPLAVIGLISYGLYLYEGLFLVIFRDAGYSYVLRAIFAVPLSFGAAAASYLVVEPPILRRVRAGRALRESSELQSEAAPQHMRPKMRT